MEKVFAESEKRMGALLDPNLSANQRLAIFKELQAWPRIVLGMYRAELARAQTDRKDHGIPAYGSEEPSEIAYRVIGDAVGLGPDRIRDLCRQDRRHEEQGMPHEPTAAVAQFKEELSGNVQTSLGPKYIELVAVCRELSSLRKQEWLADLEKRFSTGRPLV
jgi:hypothetical protein